METRNGERCVHTGLDGTRVTRVEKGNTYVRVQLMPVHPTRIVWVNEYNLKGSADYGRRGLLAVIK